MPKLAIRSTMTSRSLRDDDRSSPIGSFPDTTANLPLSVAALSGCRWQGHFDRNVVSALVQSVLRKPCQPGNSSAHASSRSSPVSNVALRSTIEGGMKTLTFLIEPKGSTAASDLGALRRIGSSSRRRQACSELRLHPEWRQLRKVRSTRSPLDLAQRSCPSFAQRRRPSYHAPVPVARIRRSKDAVG